MGRPVAEAVGQDALDLELAVARRPTRRPGRAGDQYLISSAVDLAQPVVGAVQLALAPVRRGLGHVAVGGPQREAERRRQNGRPAPAARTRRQGRAKTSSAAAASDAEAEDRVARRRRDHGGAARPRPVVAVDEELDELLGLAEEVAGDQERRARRRGARPARTRPPRPDRTSSSQNAISDGQRRHHRQDVVVELGLGDARRAPRRRWPRCRPGGGSRRRRARPARRRAGDEDRHQRGGQERDPRPHPDAEHGRVVVEGAARRRARACETRSSM